MNSPKFIRYPGGKSRMLKYILPYLPAREQIRSKFIEPFAGGGALFFAINPRKSVLSDINSELIDLYRGIQKDPYKIWNLYREFPVTKEGYYQIRDIDLAQKDIPFRASRILYLNRTCFKGMWRHNSEGCFNVGYGGESRRWVISGNDLIDVSARLKKATLKCSDFEPVIDKAEPGDFLFLDPPYKPGNRDMYHAHYAHGTFTYSDQIRLAKALKRATSRGVQWAMTTSSHEDITSLYKAKRYTAIPLIKGTGDKPGKLVSNPGEVLILNYKETLYG